MLNLEGKIPCRCTMRRATIPKTRDPFINTHLLALGPDARGRDRFWTSSCNMTQGTTCVLINEDGEHRAFLPWVPHWSFYGAVREDTDTLWLCDRMNRVLRFTISTGRFESFDTGGPAAHIGQGMVFDPATKKLFIAGYANLRTVAVSFDTRTRETMRLHQDFPGAHSMRCSFPNGDGSWSIVMTNPGQSLLRWDPVAEHLDMLPLTNHENLHAPLTSRLICDAQGRRYIPEVGWFDPAAWRIDGRDPRPEREMTWFARRDNMAFGAEDHEGSITIYRWDMDTGELRQLCDVPDAQVHSCNLTTSGKIVVVNVYGTFSRFDAMTGALELSLPLPTDAVSYVDCLCRIDKTRLLGTTYITQRFWEVNLDTGESRDCGRAAPGWGEVAQTWKIADKVYMAAYIGGELVEYDPAQPARFPENPRVVARPPRGQRPVAAADDGRHIYYACTRPYPELGSVLTRYDTQTGVTVFSEDPVPDQQIRGLAYLRESNSLLCSTTMHADCQTGAPSSDRCYLARISADTLRVESSVEAPPGTAEVSVIGQLNQERWLCTFKGSEGTRWCAIDPSNLKTPAPNEVHALPESGTRIQCAGKVGVFILRVADRIELWDMRRVCRIETLVQGLDDDFFVGNVFVQDGVYYLVTPWEVIMLEDVL